MKAVAWISGGMFWAFLAPFFYCGMNSTAKLAGAHLTVWQIVVGRFALGLVVMPLVVRSLGLSLWGRQRFMLSLRGFFGSAAFLLLVASFRWIPLSVAMILFYLYPAFTAFLSPFVVGEPTPKAAWPFIGGAFCGTCLILWPTGDAAALNWGHLLAVISSIFCALTLLLVRRLGKENNIYTLFFYLCLAGTLAGLGPLLFQEQPYLPTMMVSWVQLAVVAVMSIAGQLSINHALFHMPAPKVSVIMTAEVPLVAAFGVLVLGEPVNWRLITGAAMILCCSLGLSILPARKALRARVKEA